ncbi:MAG: hypothetical protein E7242_02020 [Lachnospiraceae bacterium]|nr:hypothetical protein [Lachnospiraceae bacterium]
MKKLIALIAMLAALSICVGCEGKDANSDNSQTQAQEETKKEALLEDGTYTVDFTTDSTMFHINETLNDKATLTVKDGEMNVHITLAGTGIVNLFVGTAEDAQKEGAQVIDATEDEVTYDDGMTEKVSGFDLPITVLDEEFDVAILGKKGKWYDHKVKVSNVVEKAETAEN